MAITGEATTFVTETIYAWLCHIAFENNTLIQNTNTILTEILHAMGHTEPYNAEQRAINDMLRLKKADRRTCLAAWDFYNAYYGYEICLKDLAIAA